MPTAVEAVASTIGGARAFFILSPDSILSGRAATVLEEFASSNLRVIGYRWHRLSASDVNSLYAKNRGTRSRSHFDGLVEQLFTHAESFCGWLATADPAVGSSLFATLQQLKGPSDPCKCSRDQLRRSLGATNKVMNLIHTSDDGIESAHECKALFGSARLEQPPPLRDLLESVQQRSEGLPISAIEVTFTMKERLAQQLRGRVPELDTLLMQEKCLLTKQLDRVSTAAQIEEIHARQISALETQPESAALFEELSAIGLQRKSDSNFLQLRHRAGLPVEGWEALVLQCGGSPL